MTGSMLRLLLLSAVVVLVYFIIMRPRELRRAGRIVRLVGMVYVVSILLSSLLRLTVGWGM